MNREAYANLLKKIIATYLNLIIKEQWLNVNNIATCKHRVGFTMLPSEIELDGRQRKLTWEILKITIYVLMLKKEIINGLMTNPTRERCWDCALKPLSLCIRHCNYYLYLWKFSFTYHFVCVYFMKMNKLSISVIVCNLYACIRCTHQRYELQILII